MQLTLLTLAFILELVAFTGFSSLGLLVTASGAVHATFAILLFTTLVTFWSIYMAPKAIKKLRVRQYYVAKAIIYICSAVGLFHVWGRWPCATFIIAVIADELLLKDHNLLTK